MKIQGFEILRQGSVSRLLWTPDALILCTKFKRRTAWKIIMNCWLILRVMYSVRRSPGERVVDFRPGRPASLNFVKKTTQKYFVKNLVPIVRVSTVCVAL